MQREEFEYLYIHANCLAELALQQIAAELEASMASSLADPNPPNIDELEAQVLVQLGQLDLSTMMDGFVWDNPESDAAVLCHFKKDPDGEELAEESVDSLAHMSEVGSDADPREFNLGLYLEKAYAAQGKIKSRVDSTLVLVDMDKIEILLYALPAGYPPITGPLSPDEFTLWLDCYLADHEALTEIVVYIHSMAQIEGENIP